MGCKYETVADMIKKSICCGQYKPGGKLPSIKALSRELGLNADTIVRAYKQLEEEHAVYAVRKSGYYVMKNEAAAAKERVVDMLSVNMPDTINPYNDFLHCMDKAVSIYGKELFEYSSPKGLPQLINALVKHLMSFQVFAKPEDIFVTNGAQQALYILSAMPFPGSGQKVLLEQPTYSVMLRLLENAGTPVVGIRRTQYGIDLGELESIFRQGDIKFFYTMPRYQNPTGFCYSAQQKKEIAELSRKYGVYIVEDDYLADLESAKKSDPIYATGDRDLCIYIRSFSKTLLPGLRLGAAVLPKKLHKTFMDFKYGIDLNTSILAQGALEVFLKSSMYRFHIKKTRKYYSDKMSVLKNTCSREANDDITWYIPETGLYAYLETKGLAETLERRLLSNSVLVSGTGNCYIKGFEHAQGIRLCVCNASDEDIIKAVQIIGTHARVI